MGKIRIHVFLLLTLFALPSYAQSSAPADSVRTEQTDTISLREVQVEGAAYAHKDDHVELYMKKYNVDYGNNALDAISSLSRFRQGIGLNSLSTIDNKSVTIIINGVPADAMTLRTYRGKEILKVEYYDQAPPQYMDLTKGPLVNVITRKRIDRLYSAYIYGWQGLLKNSGEVQAALTYADSLNQVKINYYTNHGNNKNKDENTYSYPDGITNEYRGKGRNRYLGNNLTASYQRYTEKILFNTTLNGTWSYSKGATSRGYSVWDSGTLFEGIGGEKSKDRVDMTSLSIYFRQKITDTQSYSLNVTGGYADASADGRLWRESSLSPDLGYDIYNGVKNKSYSFSARGGYQFKKLYIAAMYYFTHIDQKTADAEYRPETQMAHFYAAHPFSRDNMSLTPSIGVTYNHSSSMGVKSSRTVPFASLNYKVWAKDGKLKGLSGNAFVMLGSGNTSAGQLTESESYIDNRFIVTGNPYIRSTWSLLGRFRVGYYRPYGKLSVQFEYNPVYSNRNISPVIYGGDNGYFYQTNVDLGHQWRNNLSLSGKWRVCDWFTMSPYFGYYIYRFTTLSQRVEKSYFRAGGSIDFFYKDFTLALAANCPIKQWSGDICTFSSSQYASSLDWNHGNYSVGLQWNYIPQRDYKRGAAEGFAFTELRRSVTNLLMLRVSLFFSKGRARRHPDAGGAASIDSGLREDQSVKR